MHALRPPGLRPRTDSTHPHAVVPDAPRSLSPRRSDVLRRIVVAIDPKRETCAVADRAVRLASIHGASLEIVSVLGTPVEDAVAWDDYPRHCDTAKKVLAHERACLKHHEAAARRSVPNVSSQVLRGVPHFVLTRFAVNAGADLLVKAGGCSPDGEACRGASHDEVDLRLLRHCPTPVLIDRPDGSLGRHRTLAAAGRQGSGESPPPNRDVRRLAECFGATGSDVRVVHLDDGERSNRGCSRRIVDAAANFRPSLVILPTSPTVGIARLLGRDMAEVLLDETPYSLLGVKPSGFRSPPLGG